MPSGAADFGNQNLAASDDADAIRNVKSIVVLCQVDVCLLSPVRADERVYLGTLNIVELANRFLDLRLGGVDVDQEHQGVDLLNLFHGRLCGHWTLDYAILVQLVTARFD